MYKTITVESDVIIDVKDIIDFLRDEAPYLDDFDTLILMNAIKTFLHKCKDYDKLNILEDLKSQKVQGWQK